MEQLEMTFSKTNTIREAKKRIDSRVEKLRALCLQALQNFESTADEVADMLDESVLSIRPRISELAHKGLITDSGIRRTNESGSLATVWRAK